MLHYVPCRAVLCCAQVQTGEVSYTTMLRLINSYSLVAAAAAAGGALLAGRLLWRGVRSSS